MKTPVLASLVTASTFLGACGGDRKVISVDGSSTVYPITEAIAEEFKKSGQSKARVTVGVSGTGGGFEKFCRGTTAITGASRPIKSSEVELCQANGIEYIELPVAYDGIAVVVHPDNDWVDTITTEDLAKMWSPTAQGKVMKWNDVRSDWPDENLHLFGPGVDSGTYDYFTKAIVKEEHSSRGDFTSSEDDNVLVQGVASDPSALGFFGYAYYAENKDKLELLAVSDGKGDGVEPSPETVADGTYQPLSRPVFVYVSKKAIEDPETAKFVDFYIDKVAEIAPEVGYVPLPAETLPLVVERLKERVTGSVFGASGSKVGVTVKEMLQAG